MPEITCAFANWGKPATAAAIRAEMRELFRKENIDVWGNCQVGLEWKQEALWGIEPHLVSLQLPDKIGDARDRVGVVYNSNTVRLLNVNWHWISPATRVGQAGPGPAVLEDKWLVSLLLQKIGMPRSIFWYGAVHLAPAHYLNEPRDELHEYQLHNVSNHTKVLRQIQNRYILGGDWNSNDDAQNMRHFKKESGLVPSKDIGKTFKTGGKLDRFYSTPNFRDIEDKKFEISSDHFAILTRKFFQPTSSVI